LNTELIKGTGQPRKKERENIGEKREAGQQSLTEVIKGFE
jgi:hypothetical protein